MIIQWIALSIFWAPGAWCFILLTSAPQLTGVILSNSTTQNYNIHDNTVETLFMTTYLQKPLVLFQPITGLSKVAGCHWKSSPTWLVSAGYSAWHFVMVLWMAFLNKISLDWPLTLTTQLSTSKLSDNPANTMFYAESRFHCTVFPYSKLISFEANLVSNTYP